MVAMDKKVYGKAECCMCYVRLPKPEMRPIQISNVSGGGRRMYYAKDGQFKGSSEGSGSYSVRTRWYCRDCFHEYRSKKRFDLFVICTLVATLVFMVVYWTPEHAQSRKQKFSSQGSSQVQKDREMRPNRSDFTTEGDYNSAMVEYSSNAIGKN